MPAKLRSQPALKEALLCRQVLTRGLAVLGALSLESASGCTQRLPLVGTCRSRPTQRSCGPTWAPLCCSSRSWALMTW